MKTALTRRAFLAGIAVVTSMRTSNSAIGSNYKNFYFNENFDLDLFGEITKFPEHVSNDFELQLAEFDPDPVFDSDQLQEFNVTPPESDGVCLGFPTPESPLAVQLDQHAYGFYQQANRAYLADPLHKDSCIRINEGVRSIDTQKDYYDRYIQTHPGCGGDGSGDSANSPGKSFHQYGLAIDIFYRNDANLLRKYLKTNGWDPNVPTEAWHYEAIGAQNYQTVKKFIDSRIEPVAIQYNRSRCSFYLLERKLEKDLPEYQSANSELLEERREIQQNRANVRVKYGELRKKFGHLQKEKSKLSNERSKARALGDRIRSLRYTGCPNGYDYDRCNHVPQKRAFDRKRDVLISRHKSTIQMALAIQANVRNLVERFKRENESYKQKLGEYRKNLTEFRKSERGVKELLKTVNQTRVKKQKETASSAKLYRQIVRIAQSMNILPKQ